MSTRKLLMKLLMLCLLSLSLVGSSCSTVKVTDKRMCAAAGLVSLGGICTHTLTPQKEVLTFDQFIDFLQAQESPAKGAALCMSSADFGTQKTELETACRMLGSRCTYETYKQILALKRALDFSKTVSTRTLQKLKQTGTFK